LSFHRALKSVSAIGSPNPITNTLYKTITCLNIAKKIQTAKGKNPKLVSWPFADSILTVKCFGLEYRFICPKGFDYNIYLNPYFHEYDITSFACSILKEGDVFIDVGAHGGLYTILASLKVKETGKVYSFEPNPLNIKHLAYNIEINGLHNVQLIPKAVAEQRTIITLNFDSQSSALTTTLNPTAISHCNVQTITLDEALEGCRTIKMIKIDTEGYDQKVLQGAKKTLVKTQYVVTEKKDQSIKDILQDAGFELSTLKPSNYLLAKRKNK
jgi:FkbM family methyltransferase